MGPSRRNTLLGVMVVLVAFCGFLFWPSLDPDQPLVIQSARIIQEVGNKYYPTEWRTRFIAHRMAFIGNLFAKDLWEERIFFSPVVTEALP